jgi:hypothetical protein
MSTDIHHFIKKPSNTKKMSTNQSLKIDFQTLARTGKLNTIDPQLLTEENLTTKNIYGATALHWAAYSRNLHQIPKTVITEKTLLIKNNKNVTVIQETTQSGNLDQLSYLHIVKFKEQILGIIPLYKYEQILNKTKKIYQQNITKSIKEKIKAK